jgi:hypothetical protein
VAVDRREFLKLLGLLSSTLAAPTGCRPDLFSAQARGRFFSAAERATLEALCDRILPPDRDPGARELGAADFIERLLTAFDFAQPRVFARGPFSGREPFPDDATGAPSASFPANEFEGFLPLSRLQELYWRAEIFGSESAGLPPQLAAQRGGVLVGLRTRYREGLAVVNAVAIASQAKPFAELTIADQDALLPRFDAGTDFAPDPVRGLGFFELLAWHTVQGCFAAPEYGGNRDGAGWRMLGIEGDSQPLGYAIYSRSSGGYNERPGLPLTTANPDELTADGSLLPRPLTADGALIQKNISELTRFLELALPGACLPGA